MQSNLRKSQKLACLAALVSLVLAQISCNTTAVEAKKITLPAVWEEVVFATTSSADGRNFSVV